MICPRNVGNAEGFGGQSGQEWLRSAITDITVSVCCYYQGLKVNHGKCGYWLLKFNEHILDMLGKVSQMLSW